MKELSNTQRRILTAASKTPKSDIQAHMASIKSPAVRRQVVYSAYSNSANGEINTHSKPNRNRMAMPLKWRSFAADRRPVAYTTIPGRMTYEDQGNGHYRLRSKPLRVIEVKEAATVGHGDTMRYVNKGDWLLLDEQSKRIKAMPAKEAKESSIDFYLASPDGTILSTDKLAPGMELPTLGENAPRKDAGKDRRPPRGGG